MTLIAEKLLTKKQQLAREGRCPDCGEFSYPYYRCRKHTIYQNVNGSLRYFEKKGWVDVKPWEKDPRQKVYKWNNTAPLDRKQRKFSPERLAELALPRLNGRPMTDKVIEECIFSVLGANQCPLTKREIERGIKSMKTIGKVVPETDQLINEYKLIKEKRSNLSKSKRDAVEIRINFLLKRNVIQQTQLQ